ncbi:hypothetical protein R5M92_11280 [Halomonas sp. Bachu 37]|uniref:hypothetical protein n=1 Tax=Halomonas kashgarensis TaxID=3084920 RepID=UPI003217BDD6
MIDAIAFQINSLALNGSVEAACAGEHAVASLWAPMKDVSWQHEVRMPPPISDT